MNPYPNYSFLGIIARQPKDVSGLSGVYGIACRVTRDVYVGQSTNLCNRWREHKSLLRYGQSHSKKLQRSFDMHGLEKHDFFVLECSDQLNKSERFWLSKLRPSLNSRSFTCGRKHTEETKAKMRRNHANVSGKNNPMYGVRLTGEKNPMFGRKRPDTSEFNTRTKKGKPRSKREV